MKLFKVLRQNIYHVKNFIKLFQGMLTHGERFCEVILKETETEKSGHPRQADIWDQMGKMKLAVSLE